MERDGKQNRCKHMFRGCASELYFDPCLHEGSCSTRTRHNVGETSSTAQDTVEQYRGHMAGLDNGSRDMANPKKAGLSTAGDVQTTVQDVKEDVMPKISREVT